MAFHSFVPFQLRWFFVIKFFFLLVFVSWWTSLLWVMRESAGGESVAVTVGVSDRWQMTRNTWHVTCVSWNNLLSFLSVLVSVLIFANVCLMRNLKKISGRYCVFFLFKNLIFYIIFIFTCTFFQKFWNIDPMMTPTLVMVKQAVDWPKMLILQFYASHFLFWSHSLMNLLSKHFPGCGPSE